MKETKFFRRTNKDIVLLSVKSLSIELLLLFFLLVLILFSPFR